MTRDDARAAVRLAKAGYGPQSAGLCRSIVEASINSRYIQKGPEARSKAFLTSIAEANRRLAGRLAIHPLPEEEAKKLIEEALRIETSSEWPTMIATRAYGVEKPNYSYDVVFLLLSQQVHSDVASLAAQVSVASLPQLNIRIGRGDDWVTTALATVFIFLSQVAQVGYAAIGADARNLNRLAMQFEQAHSSGLVTTRKDGPRVADKQGVGALAPTDGFRLRERL